MISNLFVCFCMQISRWDPHRSTKSRTMNQNLNTRQKPKPKPALSGRATPTVDVERREQARGKEHECGNLYKVLISKRRRNRCQNRLYNDRAWISNMETGSLGISVCIWVETRVCSVLMYLCTRHIEIYMSILLVYLFVKKSQSCFWRAIKKLFINISTQHNVLSRQFLPWPIYNLNACQE